MQACDAPHVVNEPDIDISNFNEILEVTLTWLLEAQDGLSRQDAVSDTVTTVKRQFQQHEVRWCHLSHMFVLLLFLCFNAVDCAAG